MSYLLRKRPVERSQLGWSSRRRLPVNLPQPSRSRYVIEDHTDVEEESEEGSVDDGSIGTWKVEICISNAPANGAYEEEEEEHVDDDAASSIYTDREVEEENEDCSESDEIAFPEEDEEDVEEESDSEDQDVESEDHEHREMLERNQYLEHRCDQLTAEKRVLGRQVATLSEDLLARTTQVQFLTQQLRVLKRKNSHLDISLQWANEAASAAEAERNDLMCRARDQKTKEEGLYSLLQEKSKKISELEDTHEAEKRALHEQIMQLKQELAEVNTQLTSVISEKKWLENEAEYQKTKEEGLVRLVQDKDKMISEMNQTCDVHCRHLDLVAAVAATPVDSAEQLEGMEKLVRNQLRPFLESQDDSGFCDSSRCSTSISHDQSTTIIFPPLPAAELPDVSTTILVHYAERIAVKWYEVAHALGVANVAKTLKQTEQGPERKCFQCLEAWIERGPEVGCSWEKLLTVLRSLKLNVIAKDLQEELQKHATPNPSS